MNIFLIILGTLAASAFFSGMEMAFVSSDKLRLELEKNKNFLNSKFLTLYTRKPGHYIATMLLGNNLALVVYGIAFAKLLDPIVTPIVTNDTLSLITQTLLSTLLILFVAEFLPKTLFRLKPNLALNIFAIPVGIFYILFYPITWLTMGISRLLLRKIFKTEIAQEQEQLVFGRIDLNKFIGESERPAGEVSETVENEIKLFKNALDFSKVKLRECLVPRPEIEAIDVNTPMNELRQRFIETGFSKIIVFKDSIDDIIGYVHSSDLFHNPNNITTLLRKVIFVPETMEASKLLTKFLHEHKSLAVVVDEFGGTAGIVTTEDILEEIFGEIEDEHDTVELVERKIDDKHYIFSGRMKIDQINEKYFLGLPVDDNYETIAGFILHRYGSIPTMNTIIDIGKFQFKVLRGSKTRIELIELKILNNT
ncbi:hemolysin family protein [Prolixibacter sp. SD074]|uniref:hemolysin family protein n=1 Tax=Prolixibacter sp. SD074 TaxID=2652391 RepID=UPI0012885984|nr:hemolysin family protein [Prolixibacter sp. SD074]GET30127.1 hemolysin [Prolixibacter sp. SD074]